MTKTESIISEKYEEFIKELDRMFDAWKRNKDNMCKQIFGCIPAFLVLGAILYLGIKPLILMAVLGILLRLMFVLTCMLPTVKERHMRMQFTQCGVLLSAYKAWIAATVVAAICVL